MSTASPTHHVSSTALDLPEHRRHARDACERMSLFPLVMEQMSASSPDALAVSRAFVDEAEFYLGSPTHRVHPDRTVSDRNHA